MTSPVLGRLFDPAELGAAATTQVFARLVDPQTSDVERAAILGALSARRLQVEELARFSRAMRARARPFPLPTRDRPIDLCGSGGAPTPSFNVSTVSALVVAASGMPVVKHGNRSARGVCGSSDLLEALGLPVTRSVGFARASYRRLRVAFLHAPLFHPETAAVGPVRRALGVPTLFNQLGPLTNPARVPFRVVGASDRASAEIFSRVLRRLGVVRGLAMSSSDGCDEFSPKAPTTGFVWSGRVARAVTVRPERFLAGEDRRGDWGALPPPDAAAEAERVLAGGGGARRGAVLLTSGAALWVARSCPSLAAGLARAQAALDDGRAERLLASLRALAPRYAGEGSG